MSRISIPIDAISNRLNLQSRFDSVRSQSLMQRFSNLKPIQEFLDVRRCSRPKNFGEAQERINYNLSYFSSNYSVVFVGLLIYSLLKNLWLFFTLTLIIGGMWGIGKLNGADLDAGFFRASPSQLYGILALVSLPLLFWSSPISSVFWLLGASAVAILGHGCLMEKPVAAEFGEEV